MLKLTRIALLPSIGFMIGLLCVEATCAQTMSAKHLIGGWNGSIVATVQGHAYKPSPFSIRFVTAKRAILSTSTIEEVNYEIVGDSVRFFIKGEAWEPMVLHNIQLNENSLHANVQIPSDPPGVTSVVSLKKEEKDIKPNLIEPSNSCNILNIPNDVEAVLFKYGLDCPIEISRATTESEIKIIKVALSEILVNHDLIPHPLEFRWNDSNLDRHIMAMKLRDSLDPISQYIHKQLSPDTQRLLKEYKGESIDSMSNDLHGALVEDLNQLLEGPSLFDEKRFAQVKLSEDTQKRITRMPRGEDLLHLNRLLLEAAYPHAIKMPSVFSPAPADWIVFYEATFSINSCDRERSSRIEFLIKPLFRMPTQFKVGCTHYSLGTSWARDLKSTFMTKELKIKYDLLWQGILGAPEKVPNTLLDPATQKAVDGEKSVKTKFKRLDNGQGFIVGEITSIRMIDPFKGTERSGEAVQIYVHTQLLKRRVSDYNWIKIDSHSIVQGGIVVTGKNIEEPYMKAILGSILR